MPKGVYNWTLKQVPTARNVPFVHIDLWRNWVPGYPGTHPHIVDWTRLSCPLHPLPPSLCLSQPSLVSLTNDHIPWTQLIHVTVATERRLSNLEVAFVTFNDISKVKEATKLMSRSVSVSNHGKGIELWALLFPKTLKLFLSAPYYSNHGAIACLNTI